MTSFIITLPDIGWTVRFHCAVTCYHTSVIVDELRKLHCPDTFIGRASSLMDTCALDTGLTFSNPAFRESVVVVGLTSSASEFMNSLEHELRHLVDDICNTDDIREKEDVAYLTGNINRMAFPFVRHLLCRDCGRKATLKMS